MKDKITIQLTAKECDEFLRFSYSLKDLCAMRDQDYIIINKLRQRMLAGALEGIVSGHCTKIGSTLKSEIADALSGFFRI